MLYAFGSAIAAALVAIFGKIGLQDIDPTLATIVRGVVMAENVALGLAGADTVDHRGVVGRVGKHDAIGQHGAQR